MWVLTSIMLPDASSHLSGPATNDFGQEITPNAVLFTSKDLQIDSIAWFTDSYDPNNDGSL